MVKVGKYGLFEDELHANCRRRGKSNRIAINAHVTHTENSVLRSVLSARFKSSIAALCQVPGMLCPFRHHYSPAQYSALDCLFPARYCRISSQGGAGKAWAACTTAGTVVTCNKDSNPVD